MTARRLRGFTILTFGLALAGAGCQAKHSSVTSGNEGDTNTPLTVSQGAPSRAALVRMNNPQTASQLLSGFYAIENNAWRWTAGKFSVLLYPPPDAAQRGATLTLKFTVPDVAIQKLGNVMLSASIDGMALPSATYSKAGADTYTADVPASMLATQPVKVDFALDKSFHTDGDARELGIIAASVGLAEK